MASIRRHPSSPYWHACLTLADGRRTQRSTKTSDKKKAQALANLWEEAETEAAQGLLTEVAARKYIAKAYEIGAGRPMHSHSVEEWIWLWFAEKKHTNRLTTVKRYEGTVRTFLASLGERKSLDLRHVDSTDAERFREQLLQSGKANRTVNLEVKAIASAFNKAFRQGLLERNPFSALIALPTEESIKKDFTLAQLGEILSHCEEDWFGAVLVGFYTGARLSDVTSLVWGNLDLGEDMPAIRFKEKKKQAQHRREIVVPVHARLLEHLITINRGSDESPIFPTLSGRSVGGNSGLSQSFRRILKRAELVEELYSKKKKDGVGRTVSPYGFHSFRHTFKSILANKGVPQDIRDVLTGHAKPSVAEAYVHRETHLLLDAVSKLPNLKVA